MKEISSITIRSMQPDDVDQVHQSGIEVDAFQTSEKERESSPFWPRDRLADWVDSEEDVLLVAEYNGRIVGYFLSHLHPPTGMAYIENLYVATGYRQQGIGTSLLKNGLSQLAEKGCRYVAALTKTENQSMQELLEKQGFNRGEIFLWMDRILD